MCAMLECKHISLSSDGRELLKNSSISLNKGELHAIIGNNGAGKSMLMKCIAGITQFDSGEITLNGSPYKPAGIIAAQKKGVFMISHYSSLLQNLSVMENIYLKRWEKKKFGWINWRAQKKKTESLLKEYGLNIKPTTLVGSLGMAEQKLVEIIKLLTMDVKILIFDESFSELTDAEIEKILVILKKLSIKREYSFFWVTQRLGTILEYADSLSLMHDGSVVMTAAKDELPIIFENMELLQAHYQFARKPGTEVFFEARSISDEFALNDVNFNIKRGEILGITGMMGSGRTCLAKLLSGVNRPTGGEMILQGKKVNFRSPKHAHDSGIAYLPENCRLAVVLDMEIPKNITLSNINSVTDSGFIDLKLEERISDDYGKRLGQLHWGYAKRSRELSNGSMQKVIWSRNLLARSKLFILDEPTKSLDNASKVEIYNILNSIAATGRSIVMLSSDYYDLIALCDRVLILKDGVIAGELTGEQINSSNIIKYSY